MHGWTEELFNRDGRGDHGGGGGDERDRGEKREGGRKEKGKKREESGNSQKKHWDSRSRDLEAGGLLLRQREFWTSGISSPWLPASLGPNF